LTGSSDSVLAQGSTYGYDEFNRLASRTVNSGTGPNYGWVYDRYGNRLQQNITGGTGSGSTFTASVNPANNQLTGYTYDAAGNMTYDGFHTYTYDAEGNITAVDSGSTPTYVYNALNQRVSSTVGGTITEYVFNAAGQRVSEWNGTTRAQLKGKYYWGALPVAYYANGAAHFEHQDWLGTERMRTTYNGGVEGSYQSLPFGDGQATTGTDTDANHYAALDHDTETDTDHAQFRQYSNAQGRWLAPDPYSGSYSMRNPQSFNRYVYAGNNPLAATDPSGMDDCPTVDDNTGAPCQSHEQLGTGGAAGGDGSYSYDASQFSSGSIVQDQYGNTYIVNGSGTITSVTLDQYGNPYIVNQNGTITSLNSQNDYVNDGSCGMSGLACRMQYQSMTQQSKQPGVYIINGGGGGGGGTAPNNPAPEQPSKWGIFSLHPNCATVKQVKAVSSDDFAIGTVSGAVGIVAPITAPVALPVAATFGISGGIEYGYSRIANSVLGCGIEF
jgi:RHS repeat-associated protein